MSALLCDKGLDHALILRAMRSSLAIQSHFQLLLWMQAEVHEILPHDVLISYSGAIDGDVQHYDVVSATADVRTATLPHHQMKSCIERVHRQWIAGQRKICAGQVSEKAVPSRDITMVPAALAAMKTMLFHAIPDSRLKVDNLYILFREEEAFSENEQLLFELLLPHIDAAVRKIDGLPIQSDDTVSVPALLDSLAKAGMSTREMEILEWVRNGKTNMEIGQILDISGYTVKNHLQRIFRKMNVTNRAQAVGKLKALEHLFDARGAGQIGGDEGLPKVTEEKHFQRKSRLSGRLAEIN